MSDLYDDADVQAAGEAFWSAPDGRPSESIRLMLDAVAPRLIARALRRAADADELDDIEGSPIRGVDGSAILWLHQPRQVGEWLKRRADETEAGR